MATLQHYDFMARPFLSWLTDEHPEFRGFADLTTKDGRPLQPASVFDAHRAIGTFPRWARSEGYEVEPRLLELKRPKVSKKEPALFHMSDSTC